jgi:hypothetical protein
VLLPKMFKPHESRAFNTPSSSIRHSLALRWPLGTFHNP